MYGLPASGLVGGAIVREAAAGELAQVMALILAALGKKLGRESYDVPVEAVYADRVVVRDLTSNGRLQSYPYTIGEDNQVTLGEPSEVITMHQDVSLREAQGAFLEAADDKGLRWRIRVIRAGLSGNKNYYPDAVLREAAPLFDGVRVFAKSDAEHIAGGGKSFSHLIGRLTKPRFVEGKGKDSGELQADLELLASAGDVPAKLREAHQRGMASLFGFSIDATGHIKRERGRRVAQTIDKINSVDLIIEPGAGGELLNLIESIDPEASRDMKLRDRMIEAIKKAHNGALPDGLDADDEDALETAYREALAPKAPDKTEPAVTGVTAEQLTESMRLVEARAHARVAIAEAELPAPAKKKLREQFSGDLRFTESQVDAAIAAEVEYLKALAPAGGHVRGLGETSFIEAGGEDQSDKIVKMWDDFFDPAKKQMSLRECYVHTTGDRGVTGQLRECSAARLREAAGALPEALREAVSTTTFSSILGDSITRRMAADYADPQRQFNVWRRLASVTRVNDFRTNRRTRMGGYGDLKTVAQNAPYPALATPGDEEATYAVTKRGGTEVVSIETIANDDVGAVRRIPIKMSRAAQRTLAKFALDFLDDNPTAYTGDALFHANHSNIGTTALGAAPLSAARLRLLKQAELSSAERLGVVASDLWVPVDLEETAFDLFRKTTNNDADFIEAMQMMVNVVWYWTDANNWYLTADVNESPTIEVAFLNGQEEPELFVQDTPNQGSLFSNDQITYKLRHIYGGNIVEVRAADGNIVA